MHHDRVRWIRSISKYIYTAHCIITSKEKHSQSCEVTKTDFVHTNFTFPNCLGSSRPGSLGLRRGRGGVGCGSVGVAHSPEAAANGKPQQILQAQAGLGGGEGAHRLALRFLPHRTAAYATRAASFTCFHLLAPGDAAYLVPVLWSRSWGDWGVLHGQRDAQRRVPDWEQRSY